MLEVMLRQAIFINGVPKGMLDEHTGSCSISLLKDHFRYLY